MLKAEQSKMEMAIILIILVGFDRCAKKVIRAVKVKNSVSLRAFHGAQFTNG